MTETTKAHSKEATEAARALHRERLNVYIPVTMPDLRCGDDCWICRHIAAAMEAFAVDYFDRNAAAAINEAFDMRARNAALVAALTLAHRIVDEMHSRTCDRGALNPCHTAAWLSTTAAALAADAKAGEDR